MKFLVASESVWVSKAVKLEHACHGSALLIRVVFLFSCISLVHRGLSSSSCIYDCRHTLINDIMRTVVGVVVVGKMRVVDGRIL